MDLAKQGKISLTRPRDDEMVDLNAPPYVDAPTTAAKVTEPEPVPVAVEEQEDAEEQVDEVQPVVLPQPKRGPGRPPKHPR
jgi:hypothetical protein